MILKLKNLPIRLLLPKNKAAIFDDKKQLPPFSDEIITVLSQLGLFLMKEGRSEPSIVAAGYWLRKKLLLTMKSQYGEQYLSAKGAAFHIAPGNVDTLFFYSMIISVLCGNQTILRISNKLSEETQFFIHLLNTFFAKHPEFSAVQSLMNIVQYDHACLAGNEITQQLSLFADVRVIWGGDNTVKEISKIPLKSTACNITFPDRYSVAVIQLESEQQVEQAVNNLLTDIKPFYQQACSSPKAIYWLKTAQKLQEKFWLLLADKLAQQVSLSSTDLISRLVYLQRLPLLFVDGQQNHLSVSRYEMLQQVGVKYLPLEVIKAHCGLWILLSLQIQCLTDIQLFEHCQTVTVSGIDKIVIQHWQQSVKLARSQTVKRIVPAGQALTFSHIWDGVDLINKLTS
ncbi:hypothetical protein A9Q74_14210 [Colwellia sp. 39_35_sub15_T18]|nr:hypothetical protein A9Q74_14210 [Colwellia sp. 39_35_sub15_T18]